MARLPVNRFLSRDLRIAEACNKGAYERTKINFHFNYCKFSNVLTQIPHLTGEMKYPLQLSGGQRQRASIIQQVLTGNRFILLDEPFSGLDALIIDRVTELLLKVSTLHDLNTLVIVSHDVENSLAISDTAFILAKEKNKEGATITETLDLIELGFAWNPTIRENEGFQRLVSQIKHKI